MLSVIRERKLAPGDCVPSEAELCLALGLSRPAVREALSSLEALGVVAARKGSGRVLLPLSFGALSTGFGEALGFGRAPIVEVLTVRRTLEGNFLPLAAPHIAEATMTSARAGRGHGEQGAARRSATRTGASTPCSTRATAIGRGC